MNPFEAAAARSSGPFVTSAEQLRNGARLQHLQHSRDDGRLSSSSGELDVDNGKVRGGLSPSVSAMAAVSIHSNSGPPAARPFYSSGSFLVPGYALPNGYSTSPSAAGASPVLPQHDGQRTASVSPARSPTQASPAQGEAPPPGPAPMEAAPADGALKDVDAATMEEAAVLETLATMGRSGSVFGSQESAFRAVPPRRTLSGPVPPPEQAPQPVPVQAHRTGSGTMLESQWDNAGRHAGLSCSTVMFAASSGKAGTQGSPDESPTYSTQHEPSGSSRSSGDNAAANAVKRERPRQLPPLPEDSGNLDNSGSGAATATGFTASRASYRKRSVTSPASGSLPADFEAARRGLAPPVKRSRAGARQEVAAAPTLPPPPVSQAVGEQQRGPPEDEGMTPATHARMAAYAAMVYNANRPVGYPALAVVPDAASALAEQINGVVAGTQARISPPSEATLEAARRFHDFMATNGAPACGQPSGRSPAPKAERTARRASTGAVPGTLAAAAAAVAVSAPPLANGQAVFGGQSPAMRGAAADGVMMPQPAAPAVSLPDMPAALQDFVLRHGGPGVLQAMADAASRPTAAHAAVMNGLLSRGPSLSVPLDRINPGMEPQPLPDGIRVRSNSLALSDVHSRAAPTWVVPTTAHPEAWGGPFLSGDGSAAAVTTTMGGDGVAGMMMDSATANAFMSTRAGRANEDPPFAAHTAMN